MSIPVLLLSMLLFFILFFGMGFLLNMLLRMTWVMAIIYPIVFLLLADNRSTVDYFVLPGESFRGLGETLTGLAGVDVVISLTGFVGAVLSGVAMKLLRKSGYMMF